MKQKNFINKEFKLWSNCPWGKEEAIKLGYTKYADINGCDKCTSPGYKIRFVDGDQCVGCLTKDIEDLWPLWQQGMPSRPEPWCTSPDMAAEMGLSWYYDSPNRPRLCENRPHLRKTHIHTERCVECEDEVKKLKALARGPRANARSLGYLTYIPINPCPNCGQIAERNVSTNACYGCKKDDSRQSASRIFARDNPELIMTKDEAKSVGLTLYRTGEHCKNGHASWRYVSTGNCLECIKKEKL